MLALPPAALDAFNSLNPRIVTAGIIYRNDGEEIRCTNHDRRLVISGSDLGGIYSPVNSVTVSQTRSTTDMSVSNMEIDGAFVVQPTWTGFTALDVEAGLFDDAAFECFICQWDYPSLWQRVYLRGYLGEITRTAEGLFTAEFRGLTQGLQQVIGRTYGEQCDVDRFGDERCKIDLTPLVVHATVSAVTSRRRFDLTFTDLPDPAPGIGYFELGELTFSSGDNAQHYLKQVKRDAVGGTLGQIELWESMPYDIAVGDALAMIPGCDRRWETCTQRWLNGTNFRGHGRWISGPFKIIRAPGYAGT